MSVIESFVSYINKIFLLQMILSILIVVLITRTVSKKLEEGVLSLKNYIGQVEDRELVKRPKDCHYAELNRIARALYQMAKRVQRAEKKQESFFQNASHELRTPLMSIQGYAESILYDMAEDEKAAAKIILRNSNKMAGLVEEILLLSKLDAKVELPMYLIHAEQIIERLAIQHTEEAKSQGLEIVTDIAKEEMVMLGNEQLFERAVENVISNARRYAASTIYIKAEATETELWIKIQDDGKGISKEDIPNIFKRFYKGKDGNSGIGLAITYEGVKRMKGNISVDRIGGRTEFSFSFPRKIER